MLQITLWSISPLLTALVSAGSFARLARKSPVPGTQAMSALLATVLFWSGCLFLDSLVTDFALKVTLTKLAHVGVALAPTFWFLFAIGYARRQLHLSRTLVNALSVMPLLTIALTMTNDWHHLMWADIGLVDAHGFSALVWRAGPWYYVQTLYSYGLIIVGTTILAYVLAGSTGRVLPVAGVILAPLTVSAANLLYLSPWNPAPWFDFTTLGFAAAALILDATVLRQGILDDIPVLRDRVLEQLTEGVLVISAAGRIIDVNQAAVSILDSTRGQACRTHLATFLPHLHIAALVSGAKDSLEVVTHDRSYDVTGSKLDPSDPASNVVLVFRDVTVRRDAEQALRRAQGELRRLAHTDPLTGLYNRRLFMDRLDEEIRRVQRHQGCLSVLIFDLDRFKQVNDRHGHEAGDRVLQAVADQASQVKRASDVAARIGGEEFALLLPQTDQEGAVQLAQRLRHAIESIDTTSELGSPLTITASIGLATVTDGSEDPRSILRQADGALYRAKNAGRNRVCAAA